MFLVIFGAVWFLFQGALIFFWGNQAYHHTLNLAEKQARHLGGQLSDYFGQKKNCLDKIVFPWKKQSHVQPDPILGDVLHISLPTPFNQGLLEVKKSTLKTRALNVQLMAGFIDQGYDFLDQARQICSDIVGVSFQNGAFAFVAPVSFQQMMKDDYGLEKRVYALMDAWLWRTTEQNCSSGPSVMHHPNRAAFLAGLAYKRPVFFQESFAGLATFFLSTSSVSALFEKCPVLFGQGYVTDKRGKILMRRGFSGSGRHALEKDLPYIVKAYGASSSDQKQMALEHAVRSGLQRFNKTFWKRTFFYCVPLPGTPWFFVYTAHINQMWPFIQNPVLFLAVVVFLFGLIFGSIFLFVLRRYALNPFGQILAHLRHESRLPICLERSSRAQNQASQTNQAPGFVAAWNLSISSYFSESRNRIMALEETNERLKHALRKALNDKRLQETWATFSQDLFCFGAGIFYQSVAGQTPQNKKLKNGSAWSQFIIAITANKKDSWSGHSDALPLPQENIQVLLIRILPTLKEALAQLFPYMQLQFVHWPQSILASLKKVDVFKEVTEAVIFASLVCAVWIFRAQCQLLQVRLPKFLSVQAHLSNTPFGVRWNLTVGDSASENDLLDQKIKEEGLKVAQKDAGQRAKKDSVTPEILEKMMQQSVGHLLQRESISLSCSSCSLDSVAIGLEFFSRPAAAQKSAAGSKESTSKKMDSSQRSNHTFPKKGAKEKKRSGKKEGSDVKNLDAFLKDKAWEKPKKD